MEFRHYSVMLEECIAALNIKENGIYLDCTLGGCGHTRRILEALPSVRVIGLDRDDDAIANARNTLTDRVSLPSKPILRLLAACLTVWACRRSTAC